MVLIVALISLNFAGVFCFGSSLLIDCETEVEIFLIDWLFYQLYHFENACSQKKGQVKHEMFFAMVE